MPANNFTSHSSANTRSVSTENRPLPHSLNAERAILGAILLDNRALQVASEELQTEDFFLPQHRVIFPAMAAIEQSGVVIDTVLLMNHLEKAGRLEEAGGAPYLSQLPDGLPCVSNVRHYARIVRKKAQLRTAIHAADALQVRAFEPDTDPADLRCYAEVIDRITAPPTAVNEVMVVPDMPEAVLDGRLGDICSQRLSEFPVAYAWPTLLAISATLIPVTADVRTNLYVCVVGDKGSGKSRVIRCAIDLMGISKPQLETTLAGSAEGLLEKISDAQGAPRLLSPDELGHLLTKAKIDCASFPYILNTAYYQSEFEVTAARGKQIRFNCSLGIVGGLVEDTFEQCFGAATTGGLHDRFIFGLCPQPFTYIYRPFEGSAEDTEPCGVTINRDVWEARDEWMKSIPDLSPRCAEHAIRAATVAAAFSGRSILYARHLGPARAFAEYQTRVRKRLKPNPGENPDARCAFAILGALDSAGGWVGKRELGRKIHSDRFGPTVFERAISALEAAGETYVDRNKPVKLRRLGL
jgi:hypothetical protein